MCFMFLFFEFQNVSLTLAPYLLALGPLRKSNPLPSVTEHPEKIDLNYHENENGDLMHANGLYYDPKRDVIFVSVNFYSEVWVIPHQFDTIKSKTELMHHDFDVLPNGNILILVWEKFSEDRALNLGFSGSGPLQGLTLFLVILLLQGNLKKFQMITNS